MQAIILCGGKGERLSPFTNNCPKGMIKVEGKPILEYQIEWLKKYGIDHVIFACGYLSEKIKEYFTDGQKFGVKIDYSVEDVPLGRGGAIKNAWGYINKGNQIIVTNGDIYTELDLLNVLRAHNEKKSILATICIFPYKSPYGIVRVDKNGFVEDFEEKRRLPYWVNGGIYVFNYDMKDYLPDIGDHEMTAFQELSKRRLLYAFKSQDYWKGIDTVKDLNEFASESKALDSIRKIASVISKE